MKKKILETSAAWSTSRLSHRPSKPAYYIVDCQIFNQIYCDFSQIYYDFNQFHPAFNQIYPDFDQTFPGFNPFLS